MRLGGVVGPLLSGILGPLLFVVLVLPIAIPLIRWGRSRGDRLVARWAAENRLKLIEVKPCRSPFKSLYGPGGTSNAQSLYRVSARDECGRTVEGWLRCGGGLIGLFSDKVEFHPEANERWWRIWK
jgi:hypothetical protein